MIKIPGVVVANIPEAEFCCGNLCDKEKLITDITALIERTMLLEAALKNYDSKHPLLRKTDNESSNTFCILNQQRLGDA